MLRLPRSPLLLASCLLVAAAARSQFEPVQFHAGFRQYFGFEFDATRGEVLAFGGGAGDSLWGWNGSRWAESRPGNPGPLPRARVATTQDPASGRIFLYGGAIGSSLSTELWQWNGTAWSLLGNGGPSPRLHTALAFDPATQSLYLFGGVSPNNFPLGDLWRWNAAGWTQMPTGTPAPAGRQNHAMVWDPNLGASGGVLVFGGDGYFTGWLGDTWLGTTTGGWVQYSGPSPQPQYDHAMCRDAARNRIVLFGYDYAARVSETWEWNGTAWQRMQPATVPEFRRQARLAYDPTRQRVVLYGGGEWPYPETLYSVWEWDGVDWAVRSTELGGMSTIATAYDEARATQVLFATRYIGPLSPFTSTTWEWDGAALRRLPITNPSARNSPLLWYDPVQQRTMLHGGQGIFTSSLLNDTWQFDGSAWQQLAPPNQPPPRIAASLAYDPVRQRTVLYGGSDTADREDTWEWDGANWNARTPAANPPRRSSAGLGFDPVTQRLILFGGDRNASGTVTSLDDTWAWDGTNWQQLLPATRPTPRRGARLVHDRDRNRLVLFGGTSMQTAILQLELWEWSGSNWLAQGQPPLGPSYTGASYDARRGRTLLVDGSGFRLEFAVPRASVGAGNATADPVLTCTSRPAVGGSVQLVATTAQPGPMFAMLAAGTPALPVAVVGPFCQPTMSYLPNPPFALLMAGGSFTLAVPPLPQFAFTGLTVQAVQLRGSCVDASNALAIRVQP